MMFLKNVMNVWTSKMKLFLLICLIKTIFVSGKNTIKIVGMHTICKESKNRTLFNNKANIANTTAAFIYGKQYDRASTWASMLGITGFPQLPFEYISYDVCTIKDLRETTLSIMLDERFFINNRTEESPKWNALPIHNWKYESNIMFIVTFLPDSFIKELTSITLISKLPIILLNSHERFHFYSYLDLYTRPTAQKQNPQIYANLTEILTLNYHEWKSLGTVLLQDKQSIFDDINSQFLKQYNEKGNCYVSETIDATNITEYNRIINLLRQDTTLKGILLFGDPIKQTLFLRMAMHQGLHDRTWIGFNIWSTGLQTLPHTTNIYTQFNFDLDFCSKISQNQHLFPDLDKYDAISTKNITLLKSTYLTTLCEFDFIYYRFLQTLYHWKPTKVTLKVFKERFHILLKNSQTHYFKLRQTSGFAPRFDALPKHDTAILKTQCKHYNCQAGWEKHYGKLIPNHTIWTESYGWTCKKCPLNYIKKFPGNDTCKPCIGITIPNEQRTACDDPYSTRVLTVQMISVKLSIVVAGVGILIDIFIVVLFFKYRTTPVVLASDFKMTLLHLGVIIFIFLSIPLLYLGEPSGMLCMLRPSVISILFTASLSIIVVKTYKIVRIFQSRVKMNKKEIVMTVMAQIFIPILLILNCSVINLVSFQRELPEVKSIQNKELLERTIYCNTGPHMEAQVVYLICLQIFCIIQAFKARNLPDIFNEALSIVYTSFTLVIVFLIIFPIYHFQPNELDKAIVLVMTLSISNLLLLVIMYGNKVYIIIFCPYANTRTYVRKQRMTAMVSKVDSSIRK